MKPRGIKIARAVQAALLCPALVVLLANCETPAEQVERRTVVNRIEAAETAPAYEVSASAYLEGVARVEAQSKGQPQFFVESRTPRLTSYPCTQCHDQGFSPSQQAAGAARRSHWEIRLRHADSGVMGCTTCHDPKSRMQRLKLLGGASVEMDHSYRLCAQCHATMARDWAGGAHGKRLGGWAPPRVVRGCPGCHDPHRPAIESRWPALVPNAPRETPRIRRTAEERS
jgi:hypothetical protein